jgi:hypothetical protein
MKLFRLAIIALFVTLAGCANPQLFQGQLVALNQGMNPAEVVSILRLEPLSLHDAMSGGVHYTFQHYRLNNGMQSSTYLLAYLDGKLKYWGYIEDFRRHPDPRLVEAANSIVPALNAVR